MSERYYVNAGLGPGRLELDGPEAHHLASVCRARPGDEVRLFNGDGYEYPARVVEVGKRRVALEIVGTLRPERELPFALEVAVPLPKGDRAQFLVEKLTELGVTSLVPLATRRSVVHPREGRLEKLERYAVEACKQCGRNVLPRVAPLTPWADYCRGDNLPPLRLLAHPGADKEVLSELKKDILAGVAVAVGPEGGFDDDEVAQALASGWRAVGLGPRILRVETAALVLASWATLGCQDLGSGAT